MVKLSSLLENQKSQVKKKSRIHFNPFFDSGISSYEQYKKFPFLVSSNLELVINRINQEIKQIQNNYFFSDRLILLGSRGIGKTSALFYLKDMLDSAGIKTFFFNRLFENMKHFELLSKIKLWEVAKEPVYILVDFPDTITTQNLKNFLVFLWDILIHKNYNKINLIFSMNIPHYDKSSQHSEILGKFTTIRLEPLNFEETKNIIKSRLKLANDETYFSEEIIELIYDYSKGIPRNVISASNLVVNSSNGELEAKKIRKVLETKFLDQIINDRVEDIGERAIYKQMIQVLKEDFNKKVTSQEDYWKKVGEKTGISRATILKRINYLAKLGVFRITKGGRNRVNKIISLE